jgi:hypothetical protein
MLRTFYTLLFLLFISKVFAQQTPSTKYNPKYDQKTYTTQRLEGSLKPDIDGKIIEALWNIVPWAGDFIEQEPDENTPPSQETQFKITYDDSYLYVAVRCFDTEPKKIEKRLSRRDGFQGDRIAFILDSYLDKRTAFAFSVTAAGVKGDEFVSENGKNWDDSWNPIWYVATQIDDLGWTAEMKIPFSQLKFGNAKEQFWGLQLSRLLFREQQRSAWDRIPQNAAGMVSEFGTLRGLIDIAPQRQLEIQPFTVTQYDTYKKQPGNPYRDGNDAKLNVGLDAKIGITNDLTLDLTVNPDFGQVEADPGAIALDGFQIFFKEQRPFFIENKNIFDFEFANGNDNLFYSRRIGRSPQLGVLAPQGAYVDKPNNTTILGAAKFSGKTKNGWSLGLLETVTNGMNAQINQNGNLTETLVEPMTNYVVGRAQKDFNERMSYVGGIFTATNRKIDANSILLHKAAYTAGIDFIHQWQDRTYYIEGNVIGSRVIGDSRAITATQQSITRLFQRSDASHVSVDPTRTSLSGTGGKLVYGKGAGIWQYSMGGNWRSPELELNDVGFLRETDLIRQFVNLNGQFLKPSSWYRSAGLRFSQNSTYDFQGNMNRMQYDFRSEVNFTNNWNFDIGMTHKPLIYINAYLRGGPRWRFSEENFMFLFLETDDRKKLSVRGGYVKSQAKENNFSLDKYQFSLRYQPLDALSMSLELEYEVNPARTQYVTQKYAQSIPYYITAAIDQTSFVASMRFNYTLNPNLTIQYYGQPFIARGVYSDFNYVTDAGAKKLADRVLLFTSDQIKRVSGDYLIDQDLDGQTDYSFGDPDFSFVQFRSNLVLRWEYIPGSELFLVWSQGATGNADPIDRLGYSLKDQILRQKLDNTFLIKATYRFAR